MDAAPRPGQEGTWITREMRRAYQALHDEGYAHSAEAWEGEEFAGGLYGVSLGGVFSGESMVALRPDASKAAFVTLVRRLEETGGRLGLQTMCESGGLANATLIERMEG